METFSTLLALCAGNSPVTGEFPAQRPVTRSFGVFSDLHLNKRLSKQLCGWWSEMPLRPLWHHCNVIPMVSEICPCLRKSGQWKMPQGLIGLTSCTPPTFNSWLLGPISRTFFRCNCNLEILFYSFRKTSNIRHTLVGNKTVDHSDVVGASPVGADPTTSSF